MHRLIPLRARLPLADPRRQQVFWAGIVLAQLAAPSCIQCSQLLAAHPTVLSHPPAHTYSSAGRCTLAAAGSGQPDMLNRPTPTPPGPGQESVWSYPRPAVAQPASATLRVEYNGKTIAETSKGFRTIETSHPPTYYIPREDVNMQYLKRNPAAGSMCEWKGRAEYWDLDVDGRKETQAAWSYPSPTESFAMIKDCIAFYCLDACYVDGERVTPQPGSFYGGWITSKVAGPFKGIPGSQFW